MFRRTILALALLVACKSKGADTLHVLAAASLADVLPEVAASFTHANVELVFDATSRPPQRYNWYQAGPGVAFLTSSRRHPESVDNE